MGTANFRTFESPHLKQIEETWEAEDMMFCINTRLEEAMKKTKEGTLYEIGFNKEPFKSDDTTFVFSEIFYTKVIKDHEINVGLRLLMEYGYYSGVNFDYVFETWVDGHAEGTFKSALFRLEDLLLSDEVNEDIVLLIVKNLKSWGEESLEALTEIVNKTYIDVVQPKVKIVGTFSNGEQVYEKI